MQVVQGTGTYGPMSGMELASAEVPQVIRRRTTVEAMSANGMGTYDIPAFLRKQAD
jgi:cell division protein FtsZ